MKRRPALFAAIIAIMLLAASCSQSAPANTAEPSPSENPPSAEPASAAPESPTAGAEPEARPVKLGLAYIISLENSLSAGSENGFAEGDAVLAAVTVDEDGSVVRCVLDLVEAKAYINSSGRIVTPLDTVFPSKFELGAASSSDDEWRRQALRLAAYFEGKTAEEIGKISLDDAGLPAEPELEALVSFPVSPYIAAVLKALENAEAAGASSADRLGVGAETNIMYSNDAAGGNGRVLFYSTFAAVATDAEGRVACCLADAFQCNIDFDKTGRLISDLTAVPPTKNETGDGYGLKRYSSIGKEWYEQTAALAEYVRGKTAEEIGGIAVRADTSPADTDMRATVTLKIGEFKKAIVKAIDSAAAFEGK